MDQPKIGSRLARLQSLAEQPQIASFDRHDVGSRVDVIRVDAIHRQQLRGGNVEQAHVAPAFVHTFCERDRGDSLNSRFGLRVGVHRNIEWYQRHVAECGDQPIDAGSR